MAEGNSIRDEKRAERAKFGSMTKKQKLDYIKSYYLVPGIVITCVAVMVIWFLLETVILYKETACCGCLLNVKIMDETEEKLTTVMADYLGIDLNEEKVAISRDNYVDYVNNESTYVDGYATQSTLYTQIAAGEYHYMIIDITALESMGPSGYFATLDEILPQSYMEKLGDRIVYEPDVNDPNKLVPTAISLKDSAFECDEAYLTIAVVTDPEMAAKIVDYIVYDM